MSESSKQHCFLNVRRSFSGRKWLARTIDERAVMAIGQKTGLPELVARILDSRDVAIDDAAGFLTPTLKTLMPAPENFVDMDKGAQRIADAIIAGEQIGIIGDYDVDGVTSSAILAEFIIYSGGKAPKIHIPHRVDEGYGPNIEAVNILKEAGCTLLVTLDCGVMAHDPLLHAGEVGMVTVVVDHHQVSGDLPLAHAVINPNRPDDLSGQGHLCAAGVVFILIAAINRILRQQDWWTVERQEPQLLKWLDLVALGTVCDVMVLKGVNRAFVVQGLKVMAGRNRPGLSALMDVAQIKRSPDAHMLGFALGPRLNAAGRVGHADQALKLLMANNRGEAMEYAQKLEEMNRARQTIEARIIDEAEVEATAAFGANGNISALVVGGAGWHAGVLGLVASRLKETYQRPVIALGWDKDGDTASGSGRSISGVDLGSAVAEATQNGLLIKGGGHAMAAGMTIKRDKIADLRVFLEKNLTEQVLLATAEPELLVDGALSASGATFDLLSMIEQAGPYGQGHPAPIFALPAHRVVYADAVGTNHIRCTLESGDGGRIKAIAFRAMGSEMGEVLLSERQNPLHFAGKLDINEWNGRREVQLMISDVALVQ